MALGMMRPRSPKFQAAKAVDFYGAQVAQEVGFGVAGRLGQFVERAGRLLARLTTAGRVVGREHLLFSLRPSLVTLHDYQP